MLEYDRIDISEEIDINKTNASNECDICYYWYFVDKDFKYELYLCNGCHDLIQKAMNFNDVAIVSVKRSDAINIMKSSNLNEKSRLLYIFSLYI